MKIDEPKTPYVTEEEFNKLCEDDPEWQKEFGNLKKADLAAEIRSDEDENTDKQMDDDFQLAQDNMKINMQINAMSIPAEQSDDEMEGQQSPKPMIIKPDAFNINALASKLNEHVEEEQDAEQKKKEFDEKRKNHYKNEFQMA